MPVDRNAEAGHLTARDRHLFGSGPKRILAIDGGGVRGALALAFLEEIETVLTARAGRKMRLCDYFDLIGGTSTGAIIGGVLALGYSASQLHDFYTRFSPAILRRSFWWLPGFLAKFDSRNVMRELHNVIGDRTLDTPDLLTGLAIVMKRVDTASPWVVSNNPRSAFWETPDDRSFIGNRHYPLVNLVRASTAMPLFFNPQPVTIIEGEPPGVFIDGALTPHRNPALQLLMMALLDGYGLRWQPGADQLLIVSVGTGSHRLRMTAAEAARSFMPGLAVRATFGLVNDTAALGETLLHWFSGSPSRWPLNSELGALVGQSSPFGQNLLSFQRYDVQLEANWLAQELGATIEEAELRKLRRMDDPQSMPRLYELGRAAAQRFVRAEDFPAAFDGGLKAPAEVME
jgi:hypothetical protein